MVVTYLIRFITIIVLTCCLFIGGVLIIAPKKLDINAFEMMLEPNYMIQATDHYIKYFPFPAVILRNAVIKQKDDIVVDAKQLSVGFSYFGLFKLMASQLHKDYISNIEIIDGYVIIDELQAFTMNQGIIENIYLQNTSITTKYLYDITYLDDQSDYAQHYDLGKVNLKIRNYSNFFTFNGEFVNKNKMHIDGKFDQHFDLVIKGEGVDINITKSLQPTIADVNINITKFDTLNDTIFASFPSYFRENLANENLNLAGTYDYSKGRFTSFKVAGSVAEGYASEYEVSPGQNVLYVNLEKLFWGKTIESVGGNFVPQLLLNFDTETSSGIVLSAKQVKLHNQAFDGFRSVILKNNNYLVVREFSLGKPNTSDYMTLKMSFDEPKKLINGSIFAHFTNNRKIISDIYNYLTEYTSGFNFPKELPVNARFDFNLADNKITMNNISLSYDNFSLSGSSASTQTTDFQTTYDIDLNINNLNFKDVGLETMFKSVIDDLFYTNIEIPQKTLHDIRNLEDIYNIKLNLSNLNLNDTHIGQVYLNTRLGGNFAEIKELKVTDDRANLSAQIILLANKLRPQYSVKIEGDYLNSSLLNIINSSASQTPNKNDPNNFWSTANFDPIKWAKFDGNMSIAIKKVKTSYLDIENLSGLVTTLDGKLFLKDFNLKLFGGDLSLNGNIDSLHNNINIGYGLSNAEFDLLDISENKLLTSISGPFSIAGKFSTKGHSPEKLISNMKAEGNFVGANLVFNNIDIDSVPLAFAKYGERMNVDVVNYLEQNSVRAGQTLIKTIEGKLTIAGGILQIPNIVFESRYSKGTMQFNINTLTTKIETAKIVSSFIPPQQFTPVNINFLLSGTVLEPVKTGDFTSLKQVMNR